MLTKLGLRTGLGLAACLVGMSNVFAYGLYYVGSDAACGFTDIQQAIDAAIDPEGNTIFIVSLGERAMFFRNLLLAVLTACGETVVQFTS